MKNHINTDFDLIIVGAGPAGISAAIYAARAGISVLLLEKNIYGGKIVTTETIENYPGFQSVNGVELANIFYNHAQSVGAEFKFVGLKYFEKKDNVFYLYLENEEVLKSKALIIATGTKERLIGVPGEKEYYAKGVSYCAACDGANFKNQPIAVIGGGYSAVEEARMLTRFASKVYLIHRRQEFRVDKNSLKKAQDNQKIEFILDSVLEDIQGTDGKVSSINVKNLKTGEVKNIAVNAVFPLIGSDPVTNFIKDKELLNEENSIVSDVEMKTSIKGLFVAGDVRNTPFRQVATAIGDGAIAGQKAAFYVENYQ